MTSDLSAPLVIRSVRAMFHRCWRRLLVVHVAVSLVSVLLLAPWMTALLGWLVLASGDVALTDEDILFFVLSPRGALVFVLLASLQLTLGVLEQAAVIAVAADSRRSAPLGLFQVGRALLGRLFPVFRLSVRLVLKLCLLALPFLLLVTWIYHSVLGEYDINYYLAYKPPEFLWAAAAAAICLAVMALVWLRAVAAYLLALPLVLLDEGVAMEDQFAKSRAAIRQNQWTVVYLLAIWLVGAVVLLSLAGGVADLGSGLAIGAGGQSLKALAYSLGLVLLAWAAAQFMATWLSAAALGLGLFATAQQVWPGFERFPAGVPQTAESRERAFRVRYAIFIGCAVVLTGLAGWILLKVAERTDHRQHTEIIAHRGASGEAPENSVAAIELAIEQGADWVEIDVQQTRDLEIVVAHDSDLMKVAGVPLKVRDATLEELRAVNIGAVTHPGFADQRIPTLEEVLNQVQGRSGLIIELKYYGGERDFEAQVASIVEQAGEGSRVQFMSLKPDGVRALKALRPDWKVGLLSSAGVGDLNRLEVDFFAVNARLAVRRFVSKSQAAGRPVYAWTVNDPALMSTMAGREVDGIITDHPGLAARVLEERAELGLHELLIINAASLMGSSFDVAQ